MDQQAVVLPFRAAHCCPWAGSVRLRAHHDRLLRVEEDFAEALDLLESATGLPTRADLVPPRQWPAFARAHRWHDPGRVQRFFELAAGLPCPAPEADPAGDAGPGPAGVEDAAGTPRLISDETVLACEL